MRGNVFGALGSRLGTAVHAGTYPVSWRIDTLVGQNLASAVALSMSLAFLLAIVAKGFAVAFGVHHAISIADFVVVSVLGGIIPIVVVMAITIAAATLSVRNDWDLDNVAAPVVTAAADSVTLPSLFLATVPSASHGVTPVLAVLCTALCVVCLVAGWRTHLPVLRRIVHESVPVLVLAGIISMLAGLTIEGRISSLLALPALLVVIPPLLSLSGSLGGHPRRRGSRRKLHLGLVEADRGLWRGHRRRTSCSCTSCATGIFVVLGVSRRDPATRAVDQRPARRHSSWASVLLAGFLATTAVELRRLLRRARSPTGSGSTPTTSASRSYVVASDLLGARRAYPGARGLRADLTSSDPTEPNRCRWTTDHEI